jgi:hypothetical protein
MSYNPEKSRSGEIKPRTKNVTAQIGKAAVGGSRKAGVAKNLGKTANKSR